MNVYCPDRQAGCQTTFAVVQDFADPFPHALPYCGDSVIVGQSDDGRYLLVDRGSTCTGRPGIFDRVTGAWDDVSVPTPTSAGATAVAISGDGRIVLLTAPDTALPGGTAAHTGLFALDRVTGWTGRVGAGAVGVPVDIGFAPTDAYALSTSGRTAAFTSAATNLVAGGTGVHDVYGRAVPRPSITSVSPSTVARGAFQVVVTVTGEEFLTGTAASVSGAGVSVVLASPSLDGRTLDVLVSVDAQAPVGPRDLTVTVAAGFGGASAVCGGCVTVT
jgi:hypothetical protein